MSFNDKVVIVTGASSGIGATIALKFASEGAKVALVGRRQEKLKEVAEKCVNSLIVVADVSKDEDAERIINDTVAHYGQLDVLINNAGIIPPASIKTKDAIKNFDTVIATNLRAPVYLTHLAVPHLTITKGNIINISSVGGVRIFSIGAFSYYTSKAGLDHFTRAAALELASDGIRVNTVNPGPVKTEIAANSYATPAHAEAIFESMRKKTALEKLCEPEEIADVVLFIASEKGKSITGSSFFVENGLLLKSML